MLINAVCPEAWSSFHLAADSPPSKGLGWLRRIYCGGQIAGARELPPRDIAQAQQQYKEWEGFEET
jgi:hypothetical protein